MLCPLFLWQVLFAYSIRSYQRACCTTKIVALGRLGLIVVQADGLGVIISTFLSALQRDCKGTETISTGCLSTAPSDERTFSPTLWNSLLCGQFLDYVRSILRYQHLKIEETERLGPNETLLSFLRCEGAGEDWIGCNSFHMAGGEVGEDIGADQTCDWLPQDKAASSQPNTLVQWEDGPYSQPITSTVGNYSLVGSYAPASRGGGEDRPTDDAILKQENAIKAEVAGKLEFVGNKEPLAVLAAEYEKGNPIFRAKIEHLAANYEAIRRTRGDGNCFFRSFMFSYLEYILENGDDIEAQRMKSRLEHCKQILVNVGYAEFTWEDFLTVFMEQLESVRPGQATTTSLETLVEHCRDSSVSDYVVMFFRFVTSCEIQQRADFFEPFIFGASDMSPIKFCRTSVEPMGEESDHIHITALSDALQVPIRVVYLDGSMSGADSVEVNHHDFVPGESSNEIVIARREPFVVLLYRPGHYDILYSKKGK